jgi:hypothetical protein
MENPINQDKTQTNKENSVGLRRVTSNTPAQKTVTHNRRFLLCNVTV